MDNNQIEIKFVLFFFLTQNQYLHNKQEYVALYN